MPSSWKRATVGGLGPPRATLLARRGPRPERGPQAGPDAATGEGAATVDGGPPAPGPHRPPGLPPPHPPRSLGTSPPGGTTTPPPGKRTRGGAHHPVRPPSIHFRSRQGWKRAAPAGRTRRGQASRQLPAAPHWTRDARDPHSDPGSGSATESRHEPPGSYPHLAPPATTLHPQNAPCRPPETLPAPVAQVGSTSTAVTRLIAPARPGVPMASPFLRTPPRSRAGPNGGRRISWPRPSRSGAIRGAS
jgi:hypothetical protein